ncbi:hypothetical protein HPB50_026611 [Hyalomma asiaticum]|uniref:Uncharacterized protein n=1 Tax=Hyalomma asiaticum TaxID=266040 RepID=A0ACB7TP86_HYAAI|nr:hypothetical protein HPB50_026611 [Hyalomma asiaticum]
MIPGAASEEVFVVDSEVAMELRPQSIRDLEAATAVGVAMVMEMVVAQVMEALVAMAMQAVVVSTVAVVVAMVAEASTSLEDIMVGCNKAMDGVADEDGEVLVEVGEATDAYLALPVHYSSEDNIMQPL